MTDVSLSKLSENWHNRTSLAIHIHRTDDKQKTNEKERCLRGGRPDWFGRNASFADRTAVGTLEQVMTACKLTLPQDWKMRSNRRLADLKNAKSREAVLDSALRWFRSNDISMRAVTDESIFNSFSTAMNCELNLTSSSHGVSRKWYDFLRPDLPSLSAYLSVGRQLAWETACAHHLNRLLAKTGQQKGESGIEEDAGSAAAHIDLVVCDADFEGNRRVKAFNAGQPVGDIDPKIIQEAVFFADEVVKAVDAPGLAETDLSSEGAEQAIVQDLQSITLNIGTAFGDAIENWQPYYDDNGNILAVHPLIRAAQLSQSWEFDMQAQILTVGQTSQFSDQDAVDQFLQRSILDVSAQQWQGSLPTDSDCQMLTPAFNLGGAHLNSMYAIDNDLFYSILQMQQTQESMAGFAIAKQNWETSVPMLEWCRQELSKQGRATDLLDERLALYNNALQAAYFNMMLSLMSFGPITLLKGAILQPHSLIVEDFSMGIHLNTPSGMFIMDDENSVWEDRFGKS